MTGIAAGQLRSFVERIECLKEEQDALKADVRDIYAEAKGNGFDKTALGQVVSIRRKRAKDPGKFEERNAIVAMYLATLDGKEEKAPRAHTRAREAKDRKPAAERIAGAPGPLPTDPPAALATAPAEPAADKGSATPSTPPAKDAGPIPSFMDKRPSSHVGHA